MEKKVKVLFSRRKFFAWGASIAGAVVVTGVFQALYSGSLFQSNSLRKTAGKTKSKRRIKNKGTWTTENLVLNTKTKVIHFPTKRIFRYRGEIAQKHMQIIGFENWKKELPTGHFNKDHSGIVLEKLALKELLTGINPQSLQDATAILSLAFTEEYFRQNRFNWRIYDLLLTTMVLPKSYTADGIKRSFLSVVAKVDLRNARVPKKNSWLKSAEQFDQKISYLQNNKDKLVNKLSKRAKDFWSV
jgi:hypothetical protein